MRDLFDGPADPRPLARHTDPASSHEAAARAAGSGAARRHAEAVLAVLREMPGATGRELSAAPGLPPGMDVHEVRRRLPDLRRFGLAVSGPPRVCAVAKTKAVTWWPADLAQPAPAAVSADEYVI